MYGIAYLRREDLALSESKGLRFDIFERIRLSEETNNLDRLEQIELLPHIEVLSQGEHAVLKGHLLLTGQFSNGGNQRANKLEHSIPVEITLPMNRIPNLDEIRVDIENFDVDLVSPNLLNVTGVLSLNGIELLKTNDGWQETGNREEVFVHHAASAMNEEDAAVETDVAASSEEPAREVSLEGAAHEAEEVEEEADSLHTLEKNAVAAFDERTFEQESAADQWQLYEDDEEADAVEEIDRLDSVEPYKAIAFAEDDTLGQQSHELESVIIESDERQHISDSELKIAFGSRQTVGDAHITNLNALADRAHTDHTSNQAVIESEEQQEETRADSSSEGVDWRAWFIGKETQGQQFSSLRMCIVQREETIDSIAQRYSLNPREIMLYNRMQEHEVNEGQVLYIP